MSSATWLFCHLHQTSLNSDRNFGRNVMSVDDCAARVCVIPSECQQKLMTVSLTGENVSDWSKCQLHDPMSGRLWVSLTIKWHQTNVGVEGDNICNRRQCQESEKLSGTGKSIRNGTNIRYRKNARNRRQCQEPDKLSGTGKMAGKGENVRKERKYQEQTNLIVRSRRNCQEQAKLSRTGETVRKQAKMTGTGGDVRNRRTGQEQGKLSGTGETVTRVRETTQQRETIIWLTMSVTFG